MIFFLNSSKLFFSPTINIVSHHSRVEIKNNLYTYSSINSSKSFKNKIVTKIKNFKTDNISNAMINSNDTISIYLRSKH